MSVDYIAKVMHLLAKAESTEFPAEAEAFVEKAQELIARHAITDAMLSSADPTRHDEVTSTTVVCERPYARAKAVLLSVVANANGCQVVARPNGGEQRVDVFGFPRELEHVKTLYAALSLHAVRTILNEPVPPGVSAKRFRQSFLLAFGVRIGDRLAAIRHQAQQDYETETGVSTALVLADRSDLVAQALKDTYPKVQTTRVSSSSPHGQAAGRRAADRADLGQKAVRSDRRSLPPIRDPRSHS